MNRIIHMFKSIVLCSNAGCFVHYVICILKGTCGLQWVANMILNIQFVHVFGHKYCQWNKLGLFLDSHLGEKV